MSCRKVVIIDDEPIICNLIKRLGEWDRLNLEIVGSATDGLEGYRLIRELHPDIVLLDIRMPGLDGLELIEKCSEEKLTSRFIIISGYQEFEYAKKAIHFNISDYLVKPIDREELNMALKKSCLAIEEAQQKQTALQSLQMTIKEKNMHLWLLCLRLYGMKAACCRTFRWQRIYAYSGRFRFGSCIFGKATMKARRATCLSSMAWAVLMPAGK